MSASWLITDGFSGEASGVTKIVTMGLYSDETPPPAAPTYTANWLSPSMRMSLILYAAWLGFRCLP